MILFISPKYGCKSDTVSLIKAAQKRGIQTNTLLNHWNPDHAKDLYGKSYGPCAIYGERVFCEFLADELDLNLHANSLDWITKVSHEFVKRSVKYGTLKSFATIEKENRSILDKCFLEPAYEPWFQPAIYTDKFPNVPLFTPILVSNIVDWTVKYRFVIINGKIATYCCYKIRNNFNDPKIYDTNFLGNNTSPQNFVKRILEHNNTAVACILDVGFIEKIGWSICNTYPVWSSDLYGCDADEFLKSLFMACQPIYEA